MEVTYQILARCPEYFFDHKGTKNFRDDKAGCYMDAKDYDGVII